MARCKHTDAYESQHLDGWRFYPECRTYVPVSN